MIVIAFTVEGEPATKGSYRAYTVKRRDGRVGARVDNDNPRCKSWQSLVAWKAKIAMGGRAPFDGPVFVEAVFYFARPARTKLLAPRLDIDKLERALYDGMSGIVYADDKLVAANANRKEWGAPGVSVTVRPIGATP